MRAMLTVELRKLSRSMPPALILGGPLLIAAVTFFSTLHGRRIPSWDLLLQNAAGVWAVFLLPMSVTLLTALAAHMEHGPRAWDHLLALPVPRWRIYAAKALCVIAIVITMTGLNLLLSGGSAALAGALKPDGAPTGSLDLPKLLLSNAKVLAAATLLIAIQFWTALRFSSFAPALALGIGGTFISPMAMSSKVAALFPWQMPINTFSHDAWRVETALALGGGLGALALVAAILHLARRERL